MTGKVWIVLALLLPAAARAEVGQGAGTEVMNQAAAQPAADSATAAAASPSADVYEADEVVVTGRSANLLGQADSASQGRVSAEDLNRRPLLRPAEVLEAVPGLMITQHSGDGKANQYFTRGFNLDHGTDFAFSADGVPVNLPSHAHGQGYSDLNFIIPDLIQEVDYRKGPYNVESGDFATAGSANFTYPFRLKNSSAALSLGEDGYVRALAAASMDLGAAGQFYYAVEGDHDDGPWDVPENFQKYNILLHYSVGSSSNGLIAALSVDQGAWTATNQTPQRAVDEGLIDRFGSLDPTDGGMTHRYSLWSTWKHRTEDHEATVEGYATVSSLHLWNDFTFDMDSNGAGVTLPNGLNVPSDQIEEQDERTVTGLKARDRYKAQWGGVRNETEVGLDFRNDNVTTLGLYSTVQRVRQGTTSENTVVETDVAPYVQNTAHWTPWLRSELGYRQDFYGVNVGATLTARQAQETANAPEPKVGVAVGPWGPLELYANYGLGFHSNDARILTPLSQQAPGASSTLLVPAQGLEGGLRVASGDYRGTVAVWQLKLASELTFNGDTAGSQVGPASTRQGLEWSNHFHWRHLVLDGDYAFSQARFDSEDLVDDPSHPGTTVPESIEQAASGTIGLENLGPFSVDGRIRYFGPRPLTPDNVERSDGTLLTSVRLAYVPVKGQQLALDVFNVFNEAVDDVSYYYASQLKGEAHPVDGLMVHPAEPREARVSYRVQF
jgi:outer membrane receptor for Fe3+-dicitrate